MCPGPNRRDEQRWNDRHGGQPAHTPGRGIPATPAPAPAGKPCASTPWDSITVTMTRTASWEVPFPPFTTGNAPTLVGKGVMRCEFSGKRRDESGAIAVIVALMAVVLIGLSAFVADFGMAYANKRQLQTAADAAALGAAAEFMKTGELDCSLMRSSGLAAANTEANGKVTANTVTTGTASLTGGAVTATCTTTGFEVEAAVSGTSANLFGGVLGQTGDYSLTRTATAIVEAATGVGSRLRPLAVCSSELDPSIQPGDVFRIWAPGLGHTPPASCPQEADTGAGNWWILDCPGEFNVDSDEAHGTSALEAQVLNGCSDPVSVVPGQGTSTGTALNNILATACPTASTSSPYRCLSGDPGQPDAGGIDDAWASLIRQETLSIIPVFCAATPGLCDHSSVTGTGTNAVFPVHKFVGVTICGFHFGKQNSKIYREPVGTTNGDCAAANIQSDSTSWKRSQTLTSGCTSWLCIATLRFRQRYAIDLPHRKSDV